MASSADGAVHMGRQLLAKLPEHCNLKPWEEHGGVVLYALGVVYLIFGLVAVNNHYFMPSLRRLSRLLQLSDNVAGATIFAGGSSAPFVFFGFFALLAPNSAIPNAAGIASTVGAGNANTLGVIGIAAALCMPKQATGRQLAWYPLARDAAAWAATVLVLGGIVSDGKVHWWEGLILVALYCGYVGLNAAHTRITAALERCAAARKAAKRPMLPTRHDSPNPQQFADSAMDMPAPATRKGASTSEAADPKPHQERANSTAHGVGTGAHNSLKPAAASAMVDSHVQQPPQQSSPPTTGQPTPQSTPGHSPSTLPLLPAETASGADKQSAAAAASQPQPEDRRQPAAQAGQLSLDVAQTQSSNTQQQAQVVATPEEVDCEAPALSQFRLPAGFWPRLGWLVCLPWYLVLTATVPDCRALRLRRLYPATILMAMAWIGGISWFLLLWTLKVGCVARAPLTVMGATLLAIGSTMLTALVSFTVAREGKADMAVSNAMGSSVFNVLIGLGLPFFVVAAARGRPEMIDPTGLWPDVGALLVALAAFLVVLLAARLRLTRAVGWLLIGGYFAYVLYVVLTTWVFDVFGTRHS